jgi:hypothetical protein
MTRSPSLSGWAGGWGTQEPEHAGAHGHHPDDRGDVDEPGAIVRSYHPHPACRVERWWILTWWVGFCRHLSNNDLTGTIPTNVGLMTSLTELYDSCHPPPCVSR